MVKREPVDAGGLAKKPGKKTRAAKENSTALKPKVGAGFHSERGKPRKGDGATEIKIPKSKPYGNSKGDRAWLEEQIDAGNIEEIPDDEVGIPFGALVRWTQKVEDIGSPWQLPPEERRCRGRSKIRDNRGGMIVDADNVILTRPCVRWAIPGGAVCTTHGGGIKRVRDAARMRLLLAADPLIGALIKIALDETQDAKARVSAISTALDRAGIKTADEITISTPEWQGMLKEMFTQGWDGFIPESEEGGGS